LLKISNLTKKYHKQTILNNISINMDDGKIYKICGANGSGKSTFIKCI